MNHLKCIKVKSHIITMKSHQKDMKDRKKDQNCKLLFQKNPIYINDIEHEIT